MRGVARAAWLCASLSGCSATPEESAAKDEIHARLQKLAHTGPLEPKPDVTNAWADDPKAAELGHKLFFDARFSGPLLEDDNDGTSSTLGIQGESRRVSCAGCHLADSDFLDTRSSRRQISLGSGWTRRRTPSLLDFGQRSILMWDGRRDTAFNQIFGVVENPLEFNSSRQFVAQEIARLYAGEYSSVFGEMPDETGLPALAPEDAGCAKMPEDQLNDRCPKPGDELDAVVRVLVNAGKAIAAYERRLACGESRFDRWMAGDETALDASEQRGAELFVRSGCDSCHSGPNFSDEKFHNVGAANVVPNFVPPYDDPGAAPGLAKALADPLSSKSHWSDGDDGRLDDFDANDPTLVGAFRTPSLRCVGRRPSFLHAGQLRSLEDAVKFFADGGDPAGFQGEKDARIVPLGLDKEERADLVAFLRALDGPGADEKWKNLPELPPEP
jgi:cytochrome c peroxidase